MTITICATVSQDYYNLAKENHISWSEALRKGLAFKFGELNLEGFELKGEDTLRDRIQFLSSELAKAGDIIARLEEQHQPERKGIWLDEPKQIVRKRVQGDLL
jgi:endonuclease YncB( thermonuclease family)